MVQTEYEMNDKRIKALIIIALIIGMMLLVKHLMGQHLSSVDDLRQYMMSLGILAPAFLTVFQAFQVVVPVVPGYLGCAAGAVAFGTPLGFTCNYIGISGGSIVAYFLARKYGMTIVMMMFSQKQYDKWEAKINQSKSYERFLFVATLLPMFPDDFLCYFSGLIKMDAKRFIWIIILGKPWCILAYSIVFGLIG